MKRPEILRELPKYNRETQSEQMLLEKQHQQACTTHGCTNLQFVKNVLSVKQNKTSYTFIFKKWGAGNSLAVQWLGLSAFTAMGLGSISGRGTKIPQATRHDQKRKRWGGGLG